MSFPTNILRHMPITTYKGIMKRQIPLLILIALASARIDAQNTNAAYFADGYLYRHEMNPAIANEQGYISMPALGNVNVTMRSNLATDNVIYNINGKTTTFMNPDVSASSFMKGINDKNKIGADIRLDVLSLGFKGFGGYNTLGVSVRSNVGTVIPEELFKLAKEGVENKTYNIEDFKAHADAYAEVSIGHSHAIGKKLRIGAKAKLLIGYGNIDAEFDKAQLTLGEDSWTAMTDARVQSSLKGLAYKHETSMRGPHDAHPHTYVSGADIDGAGLNGYGIAFDFGAVYRLTDDLSLSASLLDVGCIGWKNNMVASTNGLRTFDTDKYIFNVDEEAENCFDNELDNLSEGLASLYELDDIGDQGKRTVSIGATMNIGAEYTLPSYRKLSFGILNTTRLQGAFSWTEFRLSANICPTKFFSASASVAAGTFGTSFGWIINLHPNGLNLYCGMDHTLGKLAKQGVPLSGNGNVNVGINFPF